MAQREITFKKPSYRVYKRILKRYMRVKMGYETSPGMEAPCEYPPSIAN